MKSFNPGIYDDVSIRDYHTSDGLSNSSITKILDCPKRFKCAYYEEESTDSMKLGTAVHTMTLEPHLFEDRFFVLDEGVRKTSSLIKSIKEESPDKEIINHTTYECAKAMSFSLLSHPLAKQFSDSHGNVENSIFWQHKDSDIILKSRPDFFNDHCIIDIKTTRDASPASFSKSIFNFGYHKQAALAVDGLATFIEKAHETVVLLVVESKFPYVTAAYGLSNECIEQGRREYQIGVEKFKECKEKDEWPSYVGKDGQPIIEIDLPVWAYDQERNTNLYYG
jgi:exodeoxyribonuclease VIII